MGDVYQAWARLDRIVARRESVRCRLCRIVHHLPTAPALVGLAGPAGRGARGGPMRGNAILHLAVSREGVGNRAAHRLKVVPRSSGSTPA